MSLVHHALCIQYDLQQPESSRRRESLCAPVIQWPQALYESSSHRLRFFTVASGDDLCCRIANVWMSLLSLTAAYLLHTHSGGLLLPMQQLATSQIVAARKLMSHHQHHCQTICILHKSTLHSWQYRLQVQEQMQQPRCTGSGGNVTSCSILAFTVRMIL